MLWRRIHRSHLLFAPNQPVRYARSLGPIVTTTTSTPPSTRSILSSKPTGIAAVLPTRCNYRTITTEISTDEAKVIEAFEGFLISEKDGTLSIKQLCGTYLERLCRSGNIAGAACLLKHLHEKHLMISLNDYNILLATSIEANHFNLFCEFFKNLLLSTLPPDLTTYTNAAKAFRKASQSEILRFIREVSQITLFRDPTVLNRIISVTATYGEIEKSLMVFEELKNLPGCKLDTVTFNTALVILGRQGLVNEMLSQFVVMRDFGCAPDVVTYNTLINCLRRAGRLDLCRVYAKEMIDIGIDMDLRTYTALVDAFGRAGLVEDALRVFNEMKKKKMQPSIYVYRTLISDLKKAGRFELALKLLEEMNSSTSKLVGPEDFRQEKKARRRMRGMG